jgi:hypothetical protein
VAIPVRSYYFIKLKYGYICFQRFKQSTIAHSFQSSKI